MKRKKHVWIVAQGSCWTNRRCYLLTLPPLLAATLVGEEPNRNESVDVDDGVVVVVDAQIVDVDQNTNVDCVVGSKHALAAIVGSRKDRVALRRQQQQVVMVAPKAGCVSEK